MTKIEGINSLVKAIYGKNFTARTAGCGQCYWVECQELTKGSLIWVDCLKGGRVSIKIKFFKEPDRAKRVAKAMWNWLYYFSDIPVDAASKADTYTSYPSRFGGPLYAARLKCDKWW